MLTVPQTCGQGGSGRTSTPPAVIAPMVDGSESTVSDIAQIRSSKLHGIYFSGRCKGSLTINKSNRKLHRFSTEIPGLLIQSVFRSALMIPGSISISWNPVLIQSAEHRATSEFFIDRSQAEKWRALSSTCQERFPCMHPKLALQLRFRISFCFLIGEWTVRHFLHAGKTLNVIGSRP